MSTAKTPVAAANTPVVVKNENAAIDYLITTERSRPVLALNDKGELVVCCKTTAKKHGWEVQGRMYVRVRSSKKAVINEEGKLASKPAKLPSLAEMTRAPRKADARADERRANERRTSMKAKLQADADVNTLLGL
jgi:hypothetical protein